MVRSPLRQSKKVLAVAFSAMLAISLAGPATPAVAGTELLMVEQTGCAWCAAWNEEIGGIYHLTAEGKRAPLRRQDLFEVWPA